MKRNKYNNLVQNLLNKGLKVSKQKGEDYTVGDEDVLANFKTVAKRTGLTPKQVLGIYMMKHQDAISNYIKSDGQSESEPIEMRIIDNINYLLLLWGLIQDENEFGESKGETTTTVDSKQNLRILPELDRERRKVNLDGSVWNGYPVVGISKRYSPFRSRSQESGKVEYLGFFGPSRTERTDGQNTNSSVQEEPQQDLCCS